MLHCANVLTTLRLLLVPVLAVLLIKASEDDFLRTVAFYLLLALQISDILDGYLARAARKGLDVENRYGQIMDPLADKIYINVSYVILSMFYGFWWWLTALIITRDFLLAGGWAVRALMTGRTKVRPNVYGKTADTLQAFLIIGFVGGATGVLLWAWSFATAVATVVSGVSYAMQEARPVDPV